MSDQLWGHDLSHAWLRREICAYLLAHRERCENFVDADGGFDKYVREMQTTGTYGGHLELQVCAWLMRVNIKVIQPTVCCPPLPPFWSARASPRRRLELHTLTTGMQRPRCLRQSVYIISPSDESPAPASTASTSAPPSTVSTAIAAEAGQPGSSTPTTAPSSPSSSLSSLTPSPPPGTSTTTAPSAATTAFAAATVEEPPAAGSSTVNTIYVAYHAYEHYSSVRNLAGPKTGLPCTREIERPPSATSSSGAGPSRPGSAAEWKAEDAEPVPTNEEMLVLSSLPPSAFTLADIRRAAAGLERADPRLEPPPWESVVELLLERFEASGSATDRPADGPASSSAWSSKTAWREVDGLAGTESDASGRTTTTASAAAGAGRGKKAAVLTSSGRGRGRGRGRGKSRSSLGARVAGRRAGSSPSTASSSEGGSSSSSGNLHDDHSETAPAAATRSTSSSLAIPGAGVDDDDVDDDDGGHGRSSPSLSPPPDSPPASPFAAADASTAATGAGTTRVRLKRPPPSSAGSYTQPPTLGRPPGKERRRERKARVDQAKAVRRSAGAVGVGLRTRSRASGAAAEKVGEVEGGMREIHI